MPRISLSLCTAPAFPQSRARWLQHGLAGTGEFGISLLLFLEEAQRGGIFPYKRHPSRVGAGVTAARHRPFSFPLPGLFLVRPKAALCPGSWPCLGLTRCLSPPERDGGESIIPHTCRNASVPGISPPRLPQPDSFHREIFSPAVRALEVQHPRGFPAGRQLQGIQQELFFHSRQERALPSHIYRHLRVFLAGGQLPMWHDGRARAERSPPAQEHPSTSQGLTPSPPRDFLLKNKLKNPTLGPARQKLIAWGRQSPADGHERCSRCPGMLGELCVGTCSSWHPPGKSQQEFGIPPAKGQEPFLGGTGNVPEV